MMNRRATIALSFIAACWVTRSALEADPVSHVLVQLPVLAWAGYILVPEGLFRGAPSNRGGWPALLIALFTAAFWMLPRSIDAALASPTVEVAKFVTVPLGIGSALAIGWPNTHPLFRGFLKAQSISMLLVLAFLYTHAPVRICNAYLVNDQERLGLGFLFAAIALALLWIIPLFFPRDLQKTSMHQIARAA